MQGFDGGDLVDGQKTFLNTSPVALVSVQSQLVEVAAHALNERVVRVLRFGVKPCCALLSQVRDLANGGEPSCSP